MDALIILAALFALLAGYLCYLIVDGIATYKTIKQLSATLKEIRDYESKDDKSRENG